MFANFFLIIRIFGFDCASLGQRESQPCAQQKSRAQSPALKLGDASYLRDLVSPRLVEAGQTQSLSVPE